MAVNVNFRPYPAGKKTGKKYQAYFYYKGKQPSKAVTTKKQGREWAEAKVKEIDAAERKAMFQGLMFADASAEYLDDCVWMSQGYVQEKYRVFTDFAEWMVGHTKSTDDFPFDSIQIPTARKYYRHVQNQKTIKTANVHIKQLKSLWNWQINEGKSKFNPWSHVKQNEGEEHQEYVPPSEDVVAVLLAAKPWQQDYLNIILKTGCRASDPRRLQWPAVNFDQEWIAFWSMKRKGGEKKYRKISMPKGSKLYEIIWRLWENRDKHSTFVFTNPKTGTGYERTDPDWRYMLGDKWNKGKLENIGLCSKVGVQRFTMKSLRHFVALRLDDSGKASLTDIQKLLGHERATTTDTYLKGLRGDTHRAAAILDDDDLLEDANLKQNSANDSAKNLKK